MLSVPRKLGIVSFERFIERKFLSCEWKGFTDYAYSFVKGGESDDVVVCSIKIQYRRSISWSPLDTKVIGSSLGYILDCALSISFSHVSQLILLLLLLLPGVSCHSDKVAG